MWSKDAPRRQDAHLRQPERRLARSWTSLPGNRETSVAGLEINYYTVATDPDVSGEP